MTEDNARCHEISDAKPRDDSALIAYFGGTAMSMVYLSAVYAMYRSEDPLPLRSGEVLTRTERPTAYRFFYGLISSFGWMSLLACALGIVRSLSHVA